jgi:hypothetical protein
VRDDSELTQRILAAARRRTQGHLPDEADDNPELIARVARDLAATLSLGLHPGASLLDMAQLVSA